MIVDIILLIVGLALILVGANCLTDGASSIAKRLGISELVVGLTIVAFGTSAPELVISVMSAMKDNAGLAIGNVVGSNIFNILGIVGCVAIVRPIKIEKSIMTNEIPLMVLSSFAMLACANGVLLNNQPENLITRSDGILLLLFFLIFMRYTASIAKDAANEPISEAPQNASMASSADDSTVEFTAKTSQSTIKSILFVVGGLAALIWGGELFVDNASAIASSLNVSDAVIGLTIVALGTSLPELATSLVAAVKGQTGIAVGNVIGSFLFNIFLVLGVSATIHPLTMGGITNVDLLVMTGSAVLFWLTGWLIKKRTITRGEGILMVVAYVAYTAWLIANAA